MAKKGNPKEKSSKIEVNVPPEFGYTKWESWGKNWEKNWQQKQRAGTLWFGLFLLAIGGLWYSSTIGLIMPELVCPGIIIIIGAVTVLKALTSYITH